MNSECLFDAPKQRLPRLFAGMTGMEQRPL
jgi:hypothetical protein